MPYRMIYTNKVMDVRESVLVYDWIHDIESETTYALCWMPQKKMWMTVPVFMLSPIETLID